MMNRERYLRSKMPKANPFKVPEGYFEGLASQVMERLPERPQVAVKPVCPHRPRVWAWVSAAACLCAAIFSTAIYFANVGASDLNGTGNGAVAHSSVSNFEFDDDEFADYAMIDNADIYAYLTDSSVD